jgi:hypothetical protein
MPGGLNHRPLWVAYEIYGRVDHVYGFPALERGDGLGAAYAVINFVESAFYIGVLGSYFKRVKLASTAKEHGFRKGISTDT